ncbi:MAG: hypothetical protein Q9165_006875 [Trypethelium subeluteriae]
MPATISPRLPPVQSIVPNPCFDRTTGSKSHLFQPPRTPSTPYSSGADSRITYGYFENSNNRKRSRPSSSHNDNKLATPRPSQRRDWSHAPAESSITCSADAVSPPLVDTRYVLAGGLDTPTLQAAALEEQRERERMGIGYSRRWETVGDDPWSWREDYFAPCPPLARESNGRARRITSRDIPPPGWGKFMLTVVGGVAGRVWDFCTAGAFRGFYAGGGRGYDVPAPSETSPSVTDSWQDVDMQEDSRRFDRDATPIPGQYPADDYENMAATDESTPPRPSKRIHTDSGSGWIVVSHAARPERTSPQPSSRRSPVPEQPFVRSATRRPSMVRTTSRRSLIPVSRRASNISSGGSPAVQPQRRHSFATSRPSSSHGSPLSPEARQHAERITREEREADRSMRKLNSQLKAMIKEGKQALGTKYEIQDEGMEDEGFLEDL